MKKFTLLFGVLLLLSTFGFAQLKNKKIVEKQKVEKQKIEKSTELVNLFKAPNTGAIFPSHLISNFAKVNAEAYGGNTTSGLYGSINLTDGTFTQTGTVLSDPFPMAEEYADGTVYRINNNGNILSVNPDDGTTTALGSISGMTGTPTGLAYDWASSTMYAMILDAENTPHLCTMDLTTFALTEVGTGTGMIIAMDFAYDGFLYGPSIGDDILYQIDPATGASTAIGAVGIDLNYGQDVSYDYASGTLFSLTCGDTYAFGSYDLTTGTFTQITDLGGSQFGSFVICNSPISTAPSAVTNLTVTPGALGALNAEVSWTNPNLDIVGDPLTDLTTIELFIDDSETATYTNNSPVMNDLETQTITVTEAGMYKITVVGTNTSGVGQSASITIWIGEDVPVAPANIILSASEMTASLAWDAPTTGIHDAYFSGTGLTYNIVRHPGEVLVAENQTELVFSELLENPNNYHYEVTASNPSGSGGTGVSNSLIIGDVVFFDFETGLPQNAELIDGDCGWLFSNNGSSDFFTIPDHSNYAYVNDDACNGDMSDVWLILPPINFTETTTPSMSFENVRNADIFTIKASTDGTSWTDVEVLSTDFISEWQTEIIDLTAYANAPQVFIAFHYSDNETWGYGWAVDDVLINGTLVEIACPKPIDLNITNITTTSADLGWTSEAGTWNIEWGVQGFTLGEGTLIEEITTNPYTLEGIEPGTIYDFYVQASCGEEISNWAGPVTFMTDYDCNVIDTYPFEESFESGVPSPCWTSVDADGDGFNWEAIDYTSYSGNYAAMSASYDNASYTALTPDNYLISPQLDINAENLEMKLWTIAIDGNYPQEKFSVMVSTATNDPADFTEIYSETLSDGEWSELVLPLTNYHNEQIYIAIRHWDCTDQFQMAIDDFSVDFSSSLTKINTSNTTVYPNPANNIVTVANAENESIVVINMLGKVVANINNANANQTIDISNLSNGTYFIKVNSEVFKLNVIN